MHRVGSFAHPGPGLFPLIVSVMLGLIGIVMLVRSWLETRTPIAAKPKPIAIVLTSLIGFALIAKHLDAAAAIVFLVFVATLAGPQYSVVRNLKISAVLVAIAFAFHRLLGLNLNIL